MSTTLDVSSVGLLPPHEVGALNEQIFLRQALADLTNLQQMAEMYYHGVLARILSSARMEAQMLLREAAQMEEWPDSADQRLAKIR